MLCFDLRFDEAMTVAGTCDNNVMDGGDDDRPTSIGARGHRGCRNAQAVWKSALLSAHLLDGPVEKLEDHATDPVVSPVEMGLKNLAAAVAHIRRIDGYRAHFVRSIGTFEVNTTEEAAKAVAASEHPPITHGSTDDQYAAGDKQTLSSRPQSALRALSPIGRTACHQGQNFSGPDQPMETPLLVEFPVVHQNAYIRIDAVDVDQGRFESPEIWPNRRGWRVPARRNMVFTALYTHNGSVTNLPDAVPVTAGAQLHRTLSDAEETEIASSLASLTDPVPARPIPMQPLTSGSLLL
jgi:cytochrome c peroxidase